MPSHKANQGRGSKYHPNSREFWEGIREEWIKRQEKLLGSLGTQRQGKRAFRLEEIEEK